MADTKAPDKPAEKAAEFVRFTGMGERVITSADWDGIDGAKTQKDSRWHAGNARRLEASEFTAGALNYLLKVDGEFVLEDLHGKPIKTDDE